MLVIPRLSLLLLPLAVAGCGGAAAAPTSAQTSGTPEGPNGVVVIKADDNFRFTPDRVVVDRGQQLRIELQQAGSYPHNLAVPALRVTSDTVSGDLGQRTTRFSVNTSRAGTYRFICTFHDQAGMTGRLVVR
jgi:plastocyanin